MMPKSGLPRRLVEFSMVAVGLTIAIPLCCAYYPQYSEIALAELEEDLRSKADPRHNYLIYNKGV